MYVALVEDLKFENFARLVVFTMTSIKGPTEADSKYDGSSLRIAIVHARWNKVVIDALVTGAVAKLRECGVKESNIVIQSVPGSFELPLACSKYVSHVHNSNSLSSCAGSLPVLACSRAWPLRTSLVVVCPADP
jgi:6,7-dimethyl-8-ribityllumazine synthase